MKSVFAHKTALCGWAVAGLLVGSLLTRFLSSPGPPRRQAILTPTGICQRLTFAPDGRTVVIVHYHHPDAFFRVRLWDTVTGQQRALLLQTDRMVHSLAFSPDGRAVAAVFDPGVVKVWDVNGGTEQATFRRVKELGSSSSMTQVAFTAQGSLVVGGNSPEGGYRLWDAATGRELATVVASGDWDSCSVNVTRLVIAENSRKKLVRIMDLATGDRLAEFPVSVSMTTDQTATPDGRRFARAKDQALTVWDTATGEERTLATGCDFAFPALSPDGRTLAVRASYNSRFRGWWNEWVASWTGLRRYPSATVNEVRVYDVATGRERAALEPGEQAFFSPDGQTMAVSSFDQVEMWDLTPRQRAESPLGAGALAGSLVFAFGVLLHLWWRKPAAPLSLNPPPPGGR